ncbi:MAG: SLC13 family permease, partial [Gammaproteobacteria bacterium]|nr:SLC13 family permease [Gammaproteobacteria bacterium]
MTEIVGLNYHAIAVLLGMVVAFYVMAREWVPITVTSLGIIAVLALGFDIFPYEGPNGTLGAKDFFTGFGHEALVAICALMVLGRGLLMTGALEPLARGLAAIWKSSQTLAMLAVLLSCIGLSGILNDTPIVVLMTPVLMSLAARTGTGPGPLLMPMNFAVLIGGTATTIGTSTNLLVVSLSAELGLPRFGVFEFTPLVLIAAGPALLYLLIIAPRLLRNSGIKPNVATPREFNAILRILPGTVADGRPVAEILKRIPQVRVRTLQNPLGRFVAKLPTVPVTAGFRLHLSGTAADLKDIERILGGELQIGSNLSGPLEAISKNEDVHMVEMIISADSEFIGRRIGDLRFTLRYGLELLGIHREHNQPSDPN